MIGLDAGRITDAGAGRFVSVGRLVDHGRVVRLDTRVGRAPSLAEATNRS